jgi:hypothetical protein
MSPTPPLKYLTKCRICNVEFAKSPMNIPIVGQPNQQVVEFVNALFNHLQQKHPKETAQIFGGIQEFTGLLVLSKFQYQDPQLRALGENVRAGIHRFTRRYNVTDEQIAEKVTEAARMLDLSPEELAGFSALLCDTRDLLTEQGNFAPKPPEQKPLVTTG